MATFSTNQARQIYIAKTLKEPSAFAADTIANTVAGDIAVASTPKDLYFLYKGPDTPMRSDLLQKDLIETATLTHGNSIAKYLSQFDVALDSTINSGNPVTGQEYILRINLLGYIGLGMSNIYQKYGYVHVTRGMTAAQFYVKLAKSLALNFSREPVPILKFYVATAGQTPANAQEVTVNTKEADLTGNYTKLILEEVSQPWKLGLEEDRPQKMVIVADTILVDGMEQAWGEVTEITDKSKLTKRTDSVYRQLADMEYFYMGERGDKYRGKNWPYVITTEYMMGSTGLTANETFGVIDIHYSYVGSNEAVQKSEKDLCIVAPWTEAVKIAEAIADKGVKIVTRDGNGTQTISAETISGGLEVSGPVRLATDTLSAAATVTIGSDNKSVTRES